MSIKSPQKVDKNRRQERRVSANLAVELKVDSQVTVTGTLKDLSPRSAFVQMRESVYMRLHDELQFFIQRAGGDLTRGIRGRGRITRIAEGEGIAIHFTDLEKSSVAHLEQVLWG